MAHITTHHVSISGSAPTFAAAASGDTADTRSGEVLEVRNGDDEAITVTLVVPGNLVTGDAYPDKVYTVPAAVGAVLGERRIPLLREYADPSDGLAHITWSATTSVTRAVVRH